jgi:hypothetical protein
MKLHFIQIQKELEKLDRLYNPVSDDAHYYSKLALLELCWWLEFVMDELLKDWVARNLKEKKNIDKMTEIIDKTHWFTYAKHFRKALVSLVWYSRLEKVEGRMWGDIATLEALLNALQTKRNDLAHTHTAKTSRSSYETPSKLLWDLKKLTPIIRKMSKWFR